MAERSLLNAVYSKPAMRRRYEVWFLRLQLAGGGGAWWFRYLLMNLARGGCAANPQGMPAQVWATWFPRGAKPQSFIRGFAREQLSLSAPDSQDFHFEAGENRIGQDSCSGHLSLDGHDIRWDLRYRSSFGISLSDKGWIGFSRTPHSNAVFAGEIILDGRRVCGDALGWGLQGHNCGYRHRNLWNWAHAVFPAADGRVASFEALEYEMPLGLRFRRALLWTGAEIHEFRKFSVTRRDPAALRWEWECTNANAGSRLAVRMDGSGPSQHRLPYLKTDCSGTFEVANNSLAVATIEFMRPGRPVERYATDGGAVVEMAGGANLAPRSSA